MNSTINTAYINNARPSCKLTYAKAYVLSKKENAIRALSALKSDIYDHIMNFPAFNKRINLTTNLKKDEQQYKTAMLKSQSALRKKHNPLTSNLIDYEQLYKAVMLSYQNAGNRKDKTLTHSLKDYEQQYKAAILTSQNVFGSKAPTNGQATPVSANQFQEHRINRINKDVTD